MYRSKKILLLSHCLLNPNSKTMGSARPSRDILPLLDFLINHDAGLYQLPCPEQSFSGSKRWGQSTEQYDNPFFRSHCHKISEPVIKELIDYQDNGYHILLFLGIKGSPSCGVSHTFSANWGGEMSKKPEDGLLINKSGVFIDVFKKQLIKSKLDIPFLDLDEDNISTTINKLKECYL